MIRRALSWTAGAVVAVLLVLGLSTAWLLATESGTRWLLARVSPLLPVSLKITEVGGTLVDGLSFRSVTWTDEAVVVSVDRVETQLELLPLVRRTLRINTLYVRGVDVSVANGPSPAADKPPFTLDLPMTVRIDNASAEEVRITKADSELAVDEILLAGQLSGSALQIERLVIQSDLGDISLAGDGRLTGDYPASATATWELRLQDQQPMSGTLSLRGDASRYEVEHSLAAPYEVVTGGAIAVVDSDIQFDLVNTWASLLIETGDGRTINIENGTLHLVGTPRLFSFDGDTTINSAGINGHPVDGTGVVSYANERIQFDDTTVRFGDNRIDIDGWYEQQLSINAALQCSDLSQFGVGAAGAVTGNVRIALGPQSLQATGNLDGERLAWREYFADTLSAEFDLPATGRGTAEVRATSEDHGSVAVNIDGHAAGDTWSGTVRKLDLQNSQLGEWTLREAVEFSLSRSNFNLAETCFETTSNAVIACGRLDYDFSGPLRFDTSIDDLSLAALPLKLPEGSAIRGTIEASAKGEFINNRLQADASLQVNGLGLDATFEGDAVAANFEHAFAKATVVDNRLVGELELRLDNETDHVTGDIEIGDLFDPGSPLVGQGSLELHDLSLLSFFYPDVANPAGRIFSDMNVSGSLLAPEIVGEAGLSQGSVDIRRAGVSVTDIELLLRQRKAGQLTLQGSAKSGEGRLELNGDTLIGTSSGIRTEIRVEGDDFALLRLPDWQLTASPSITVLFDEQTTRVSGKLGIPKASISVHTVPETTERPSPDVVVHRGEEKKATTRHQLHVDVNTVLGEEVFFSGFGLTTGLEGSVRIAGGSQSPYRSTGRVLLHGGRYKAYGQNLEIESGELIFNGPLTNPALNIRATRTASDKTVAGIHLTGTPEALTSRVYSEPALADAEALSYLLTGRPLASANAAEGDMLNEAAFSLGLSSAGNVVSRIRNDLGLETLGVQGGAENRQLFAGKRFGDRLFVEYAYGMVDSLGTLLLRYQLSRRLAIESRSGSTRLIDIIYSVRKP